MSRCFPFPPPGYEKKARIDDAELLKKEKQREKKNKKEKKDKEKREGKEKRDKDRSDGKHRDKKEKKEKHRDKKREKEKDRDKDKDKSSTSEERRIAGQSENYNGEKLNEKDKERDKGKSSISNQEKHSHPGEKPVRNSLLFEGSGDSKFLQELGRRIRDEKAAGSQFIERLPGSEQKINEWTDRMLVKDTGFLPQAREANKEKKVDNKKIDDQRIKDETRSSTSAVVPNFVGIVQNRVEGLPRPLEDIAGRMEEGEKSKEESDEKRGDRRKDKDKEKKSHGKDKEREKEKKKKEKVKDNSDNTIRDHAKSKNVNRSDILGIQNTKTLHMARDGNMDTATEVNLKKRKDFEANGFLHETDARPNKMPKSIPHLSAVNGRKLEPSQTPMIFTSDRQGQSNHMKADMKERKLNGMIEAQSFRISSKKASSAIISDDQIAEASTKQPHPDSKYLNQVLSVPKMEEWSDFDDQEWLFSSKGCSSEKPVFGSAGDIEAPMAWAEALQIESADIWALPYVIPF